MKLHGVYATTYTMELLRLQNVSLWRNSVTILNDINISVNYGEQWAILGPNGSGKSFLMNIIATLIFPSQGKVIIAGKELGTVNVWELRTHIGIVSDYLQYSYPPKTKVVEVVASGFYSSLGLYQELSPAIQRKAENILHTLGLLHYADTPFGKLSYGEQKKVLIGRALVYDPDILILDEPCNGLDIRSREEFLHTLSKLVQMHKTILYVTHHIDEIMPWVNRVLLLAQGQCVYAGDRQVLNNEELLSRVMGYHIGVFHHNSRMYWYVK
ncbi:MAG: ATP-binding cassette domain-containing protein [Spirochaetes bacterium]|nr:ATP-binding cassette domain-containing protein [Spirochaetota bacterium]